MSKEKFILAVLVICMMPLLINIPVSLANGIKKGQFVLNFKNQRQIDLTARNAKITLCHPAKRSLCGIQDYAVKIK